MSSIEPENEQKAEKEPMTEEGKEKSGSNAENTKRKSVRVKMIEARTESKGGFNFITAILAIIVGSVVGLIGLALANIISIAQIVIGSIYIHDCTLCPGIPIILIINGCIGVLESFSESVNKKIEENSESHSSQIQTTFRIEVNVLRLLAIGSFIAWCVLVFGSEKPEYYDSNSEKFCHKTLYLFSFWLLNIYIILIALSLFCFCCCCGCWFAGKKDSNN